VLGEDTRIEEMMNFTIPDRSAKYPYDQWTDGEVHRAQQGVDYYCSTVGFINALRRKAKRMDVSISVRSIRAKPPNVVEFQFLVPAPSPPVPKSRKLVTTAKRLRKK